MWYNLTTLLFAVAAVLRGSDRRAFSKATDRNRRGESGAQGDAWVSFICTTMNWHYVLCRRRARYYGVVLDLIRLCIENGHVVYAFTPLGHVRVCEVNRHVDFLKVSTSLQYKSSDTRSFLLMSAWSRRRTRVGQSTLNTANRTTMTYTSFIS